MSAIELVVIMLVAIGSAITAVLITVWVSSLIQAHRVRIEPTLGEARQAIVAALSGEPRESDAALANLSRFSERYIVGVMLDLAPSVSGTSRSVLVSLGEQIGVIDRARRGVRSRRWSTRLYSARVLTAFGVESAAMYGLLVDRSPEVRAQAAAWCVAVPNPAGTDHLVRLLGDADGQCRFAAQDALIRIGLPGSEALVAALDGADDARGRPNSGDRRGHRRRPLLRLRQRGVGRSIPCQSGGGRGGVGQHRKPQCRSHTGRPPGRRVGRRGPGGDHGRRQALLLVGCAGRSSPCSATRLGTSASRPG